MAKENDLTKEELWAMVGSLYKKTPPPKPGEEIGWSFGQATEEMREWNKENGYRYKEIYNSENGQTTWVRK